MSSRSITKHSTPTRKASDMWTVIQSSKFKKDLKRFLGQPDKIKALDVIIKHLINTGTVPQEYKPHPLRGNWANHMECHIKGDFLLIWYDKVSHEITLSRLGTHSELFGK